MTDETGFCQLCIDAGLSEEDARIPLDELVGHLRGAHDVDMEIATWPDGETVIVDNTLEPEDFA